MKWKGINTNFSLRNLICIYIFYLQFVAIPNEFALMFSLLKSFVFHLCSQKSQMFTSRIGWAPNHYAHGISSAGFHGNGIRKKLRKSWSQRNLLSKGIRHQLIGSIIIGS